MSEQCRHRPTFPFVRGEECDSIPLSPPVQQRAQDEGGLRNSQRLSTSTAGRRQDECGLRNNQSASRLTSAATEECTRILQSCIRESRARFLKQQRQHLERFNRRNRLLGSIPSSFNRRRNRLTSASSTSSSASTLSSPSSDSDVPIPLSNSQR